MFSRSRVLIRSLLIFNLVLFLLFVIPVAHRAVDDGFKALKRFDAEEPVGRVLQVWLAVSTLVATAVFGRMVYKKASPLTCEATLLVVWWFIALGGFVYGYALGMGA